MTRERQIDELMRLFPRKALIRMSREGIDDIYPVVMAMWEGSKVRAAIAAGCVIPQPPALA